MRFAHCYGGSYTIILAHNSLIPGTKAVFAQLFLLFASPNSYLLTHVSFFAPHIAVSTRPHRSIDRATVCKAHYCFVILLFKVRFASQRQRLLRNLGVASQHNAVASQQMHPQCEALGGLRPLLFFFFTVLLKKNQNKGCIFALFTLASQAKCKYEVCYWFSLRSNGIC